MELAILLALCAGATWAIGMTAAKPALRHIDVLSYMIGRWALVIPLALAYALLTGTLAFPSWGPVAWAALAGVMDATLGGFFFLMALRRTPAFQATTLAITAPLWGVTTAILVLGEPARWQVFVAAACVVCGAYFLVGRRMSIRSHVTGSLFALLTGFLWGVAETVPSKLALDGGLPPASLLLVFSGAALVALVGMTPLLRSRFPRHIEGRGVGLTILSSLGGAFLGWIFWLTSLNLAPASVISPIRGSTLVFALLYSVLFLRERPSRRAVVGVFLVLAGVVLVSLG